ncbi:hypothetical protein NTE_02938 [Candidatus Nitrososphaera evergladensis SR1]|uniref:Uncharacterized protein n=1 Tax=Candidatus Nitrososphaera evergladensis SR1 TaxID=1459636 RepID=A0A075N0G1_9ARCH|nr:hypothetical protein [Candidatus Nitrososphaera evergladensis]AIF84974.1 hypothetical protein NTE_02938 [Candidatus Nitrososphaera evergladensis SR1]
MEEIRKEITEIKRGRKNLVVALVGAIIAINIIVLATSQSDAIVVTSDLSRILTVGAAAVISIIVVARQNVTGIFGRAYLALAAGLVLWVAAESTWGYYELVLQIERPFPSIADALWLSAYGPIGFHLFSMARFYGRGVGKYKVAAVIAGMSVFVGLCITELAGVSELQGEGAELAIAISIAYPLLDTALFMPAILIVLNSGKGYLTSIPWIFIGWMALGVADTLLGIAQVQNFDGDLFMINAFYVIAYLAMAAGLWWYNRFFIFDKAKLGKKPAATG